MRSSRRTSVPVSFIESLESRALLAADLAVLSGSTANLAATSGAKTGTVTIKNTGTVNMSGPVTVTFTAKPASGAVQSLGTKTVTLSNLKPNASKAFPGITLKAPTGTGTFNITVKISKAGDTNAANNSKSAGSVNIKKTGTGGGTNTGNPFGIDGVGSKLKFKKTGNPIGPMPLGAITEEGTFTDGNGHSGKYYLVLGPTMAGNNSGQKLDLDFDSSPGFQGGGRSYTLTFTPFSKRLNAGLNNKTVSFATSATGASAKAVPLSAFLPTIYLKY